MSFLVACCAGVIGALGAAAQTNTKSETEKIIYSARYYSPPGSGATSRMHLYSVGTNGGKPQQLTSGRLNEDTPRISPDGRTLAFTRMYDDYSVEICALDLRTKRLKIVLPAAKDAYISGLQWSPQSNTLAIERFTDSNSALYLIDFPAGKTRRFSALKNWAWRPQSAQLRLNDSKGTRLFDVVSERETPLSQALANTIWLNHDECARIVTKPNSPTSDSYDVSVKSVEILNLQAQIVRSVAPQNL